MRRTTASNLPEYMKYPKNQTQKPRCILILPSSMMKMGYTAQLIVTSLVHDVRGVIEFSIY